MVGSPDAIRALVEPPLTAGGLELWDVEVSRDAVRVLVDRPGGVDLDALAQLAGRVISPLLDEHPDLTPDGQFALEVSSPGVERTLRRPDQYLRYVGTEVSVKTKGVLGGSRRNRGVLVSADHEGIVLAPADARGGATLSVRYDQIDRARTVLAWGPAPKPSPGSKAAAAKASGSKSSGRSRSGGHARANQVTGPSPDESHDSSERSESYKSDGSAARTAVKRPAANGRAPADQPVASKDKESE